jgi:hypothetical protein
MHRAVGACQWRMVFCDAPHVGACRWMVFFYDAPHRCRIQRGMVLSMGDVDGWQEVFMQNYSCGDCFEVMAFRYFSMIYLSIKCFYEKMLEKLVFCC